MPASFQALLDAHSNRAHRAALGFLGEVESAKEAAQDALLKAVAAEASYDVTRPFYPWLYRIVKNTCLDVLRARKRRPRAAVEVEDLSHDGILPDEEVRRKLDAKRLVAAMATLSDEHQEVLNLRHFQDLAYSEVGELLGIAEGTVMSRLFRARRALAGALEERANTEQANPRERKFR